MAVVTVLVPDVLVELVSVEDVKDAVVEEEDVEVDETVLRVVDVLVGGVADESTGQSETMRDGWV